MDRCLLLFVIIFCVTASTNSEYAAGTNRILNGLPATENQFPYMVSLQRLSEIQSDTRGHVCGGVLVTLQHALTAAMCIHEFGGEQIVPINPDEYRVFAGSVLLTNDTSADRVRRIANTIAHPDYNATTNSYVNNIAVIILGTPFPNNTVAQLSVRDIGITEIVQCTIVGWARTSQLLHAPIQAPTETQCRWFMGQSLPNLMCGLARTTIDAQNATCSGDEGGPLVCQGGLVGLMVDARGCTTGVAIPQWYVRVYGYTTWINSVLALSTTPPSPMRTTLRPVTTTLRPIMTTLPPVTITLPPAITLPPMMTTPPPVATTLPAVTTTLPPVMTTLPPVTTMLPPVTTTLPPVTTTLPLVTTTLSPVTPPAPGAASTFQPGLAVLALIAVVQIITANVMN